MGPVQQYLRFRHCSELELLLIIGWNGENASILEQTFANHTIYIREQI